MTKLISIGLIVVFLASESNAQLLRGYGLKVAVTSASQTFSYSNPPWPDFGPKVKRRTGINVAVFAEWFSLPIFSVLTQIEYAQRGMGEEYVVTLNDPTPVETKVEYRRVDYLSVPILAKVIIPAGVIVPFFAAGPRVDVLLGYQENLPTVSSIYKDFKKTVFGGSVAAGIGFGTLLPISFSVEFRYNTDFTNSYDTDLLKVRNNSYDVWLGVAF